ncbi:hypothetical protein KXD97_00290 [Mycobacterium sp. SMC-8]|uniref:hypothetical protein n=1 Tax=Mycobacterium sp. SMC-8 TaxID=2857060 RepID=UPI0021B33F27|nr:hypothetical protein [Mycobacterium sp. SMC-8]UXA12397.1 hypothetical protein KXD97_00290 [Mycobacterium sp. SMC-8]
MYEQPRPIDRARLGRIVLASLDQDRERYEAVLAEVEAEGSMFELFNATGGALMGIGRLTLGEEKLREWAEGYVAWAQMQADDNAGA